MMRTLPILALGLLAACASANAGSTTRRLTDEVPPVDTGVERSGLFGSSDRRPPSGFSIPSTAGTTAAGASLVGGGRLSGRID